MFVSGYHDGKATVLSLNPDGSVGSIVDGVFDKGYGSVAERNFRPARNLHQKDAGRQDVMSVDNGIDQVRIYRFTEKEQKLKQVDAIRCRPGVRSQTFPLQRRWTVHLSDLRAED